MKEIERWKSHGDMSNSKITRGPWSGDGGERFRFEWVLYSDHNNAISALKRKIYNLEKKVSTIETTPISSIEITEEMVEASCPGCSGTGDQGGNPNYGACDDCQGSGKVTQPLPAAMGGK